MDRSRAPVRSDIFSILTERVAETLTNAPLDSTCAPTNASTLRDLITAGVPRVSITPTIGALVRRRAKSFKKVRKEVRRFSFPF